MTINEIANRLVALCRQGQYETAQKELYSNDAVSIEPEGSPGLQTVKGLDAIVAKGHQFQSMVEAVHSNVVSDAVVAGNFFAVAASLDVTLKGMGRVPMEEVAVYEVKDGKVVKEEFFYPCN
ncbi:MAG: nuclear transport factor 2 family protein [Chitinophagaceae bacterium]